MAEGPWRAPRRSRRKPARRLRALRNPATQHERGGRSARLPAANGLLPSQIRTRACAGRLQAPHGGGGHMRDMEDPPRLFEAEEAPAELRSLLSRAQQDVS